MESKQAWDHYFLGQLDRVKIKSKDPSTKVGAIIVGKFNQVVSQGFNGFAIGVNDDPLIHPERYERPLKYSFTIHAEHNSILIHARAGGVELDGCRIYSSLFPCAPCANAIIQAGIKEIITFKSSDDDLERLARDFDFALSKEILNDAKIMVTEYDLHEIQLL